MHATDWDKVKNTVAACLDIPVEERKTLILRLDTGEMQAEAQSLLDAYDEIARDGDHFLEEPLLPGIRFDDGDFECIGGFEEGSGGDGAFSLDLSVGHRLGVYKIVRKLGEGGMGTVYEAARADGLFEHRAAIKVIRDASPALKRRFEQERAIIARLNHPGIAQLHDGGTTADGRPYLVMEFVEGTPIDRYCDDNELTTRQRATLFRNVCLAVHHAHQHLIVHRDLKPSNILVTSEQQVKLLDFGIAKVINDEPLASDLTQDGARMLTPEYASPEQIKAEPITTASDVYSLGVILYRLLTGRSPYRLRSSARYEVERTVCEEEPLRPSTAAGVFVTSAANKMERHKRRALQDRHRELKGDLDNIVLSALAKQPDRRYASAREFAEDIDRYLANRPVLARKDSIIYRGVKYYCRNKTLLTISFIALSLLLSLIFGYGLIKKNANKYRIATELTLDHLDFFDPQEVESGKTMRTLLDKNLSLTRQRLEGDSEGLIEHLRTFSRIYHRTGILSRAISVQHEVLILYELSGNNSLTDKADILYTLGNIEHDAGMLGASEGHLNEALQIRKRLSGRRSVATAKALAAKARLLRAIGEIDSALTIAREAVAIASNILPVGHNDLLLCKDHLAHVYRDAGLLESADSLFRENLHYRQSSQLITHPYTADNLNNIALVLDDMFKKTRDSLFLIEADILMDRSIRLARSSLKLDHPVIANILHSRGVVNTRLGNYKVAEDYLKESLNIYKNKVDIDHPNIPHVYSDLAFLMKFSGRYKKSNQYFGEAAEYYVTTDNIYKAEYGLILYERSLLNTDINKDEALKLARASETVIRPYRAKYGLDYSKVQMQIGKLEMMLGYYEKAILSITDVLEYRRKTLERGNWRVGSSESMLGYCLFLNGDIEAAGPLLQSGYDIMLKGRKENDEKVLTAFERLSKYRNYLTKQSKNSF